MPLGYVGKGVYSDQQEQLVTFSERLFQAPHRFDRVVRLWWALLLCRRTGFFGSLQERRDKRLLRRCGQRNHGVTVKKRSNRLLLFVRRNVCRHKVNPAKFVALQRGMGQRDVPAVDGIKGSAK